MSAPVPSTPAINCVHCLGTERRSHPDWEAFWADRDLLYLAGFTDTEIDDQITPPDCTETQHCPHAPAAGTSPASWTEIGDGYPGADPSADAQQNGVHCHG